jgi:hypothetical protein
LALFFLECSSLCDSLRPTFLDISCDSEALFPIKLLFFTFDRLISGL